MAETINKNLKQPGTAPKRVGSGFTNIQRVLGANQQNRLGATIGQGVGQVATQARQGVAQAGQQFQNQAQTNRLGTDQDKARVESTLADPTKATDQDVSAFEKFRSGQYLGPKQLQNEQELQAQAQDAASLGRMAASQTGRSGLLQRFVGAPQYTQGQQKLDTLLLDRTGGGNLSQARRQAQGLDVQAQRASQNARNLAQQYGSEAKTFGDETVGKLRGQVGQFTTDIDKRVSEAQAGKEAKINAAREAIKRGEYSQELADALGIQEGEELYNMFDNENQINNFISASDLQANRSNVANEQEAARIRALSKLSGQSLGSTGDVFRSYDDDAEVAQAGQFAKAGVFSADPKEQLRRNLNEQRDEYEGRVAPEKIGAERSVRDRLAAEKQLAEIEQNPDFKLAADLAHLAGLENNGQLDYNNLDLIKQKLGPKVTDEQIEKLRDPAYRQGIFGLLGKQNELKGFIPYASQKEHEFNSRWGTLKNMYNIGKYKKV